MEKTKVCNLCCTKIENFTVNFKKVIIDNVNLHIHCSELTLIIGPNGAGKSTLLKAILGEVKHKGSFSFLDAYNKKSKRPIIGYVPQRVLFDLNSPMNVVDLFCATLTSSPVWLSRPKRIRKIVLENLALMKAEHLAKRRIGSLSGGELQRVLLAMAFYPVPELLLLDEPLAGIDAGGLELFYNTVSDLRNNYDLSIILVSHDFNMVSKYVDRVIYLDKSVICQGTPEEVFNKDQVKQVFGHILLDRYEKPFHHYHHKNIESGDKIN